LRQPSVRAEKFLSHHTYIAPHSQFVLIGRHNVVNEDSRELLGIIAPLLIVSTRPGGRRKTHKAG